MEVQIKKLEIKEELNICHMSKGLFDPIKLSEDIPYKINLGQGYVYSHITPVADHGNSIYFSNSVLKRLMLFKGITLNIWIKGNEIFLGPVVGIYVKHRVTDAIRIDKPSFSTQINGNAGSITSCLSYYYSIEGINWDEGKIKGYTFDQKLNKWRHAWFPMPDVLYDLGVDFNNHKKPYVKYRKLFYALTRPKHKMHRRPGVEYMIQQFRAKKVHFINNQRYLGKWDVYNGLSKYPDIGVKLPVTTVLKAFNDVLHMLNEYGFIFVKASGGAQGKEVLSIEKVNEKYKLTFNKHGLREITLDKIKNVEMFVEKFVKGRQFVVQQGIRLIKYDGRNMDLRILMMRDRQGKWQAFEHHCRIAQKTYTITNFSLGGDWVDYEKICPCLTSQSHNRSIPDKDELINATKKLLYYFEKEFGTFGEIGMDMAVDIYGGIWFIEANTKPDKFSDSSRDKIKEIPAKAISVFEYAKFLASKE